MKYISKIVLILSILLLISCNNEKSQYKDLTEDFERELYSRNYENENFDESLFKIESITNIKSYTVSDSLNYYKSNWKNDWGNDTDVNEQYLSLKNSKENLIGFIERLENLLQKESMKKSIRYDSLNNNLVGLKKDFKKIDELLQNVKNYKDRIEYFSSMDSLKVLYNSYDAIFEIKRKHKERKALFRIWKKYTLNPKRTEIMKFEIIESRILQEYYDFLNKK